MIVVFGAVGVDIVANVARIPKPGETMLSKTYAVVPGTKGANQALAAARAGSKVVHIGTVGEDEFGSVALSLLKEAGVDLQHMASSAEPTGLCLVAVDAKGENTVIAASAANIRTNASQLVNCAIGPADILVVQNELRQEETYQAIAYAKRRGARIILNLAPAGVVPDAVLRSIDVLVVNEHELETAASGAGITGADLSGLAKQLSSIFGISVIVTLGADGAIGWSDGLLHRERAPKVDTVDTTAAGDSFTGAFAAALEEGASFATAIARGIAAGSLSVTKPGAQSSIPFRAEIDKALGHPS